MKKILIVTRRMIMGGIEKALISMIESLPKDQYEVTVSVMGSGGELINQLPSHVKLNCLYGNEKTTLEKIWNAIKKGRVDKAFKIGWFTILAKNAKTVFDQEMYHSKMVPEVVIEYDLAIAYHVPASFPVVYVSNNIKAKRKVAWIHSDVSQYEKHLLRYREFYEKYDKIYCVSQNALKNFIQMFPLLKEKTSVFYNIVDYKKIKLMSVMDKSYRDNFEGIRILTIGRLTFEKGYDLIPNVLKKLLASGYNVKWYCIGDGECRKEIERTIRLSNLEEHLVLLGIKGNPYPYIKDCDLYVQPSRHEGYCITLAEARGFNKPIIATNTVGTMEQIVNGKNGLIINFDEDELFNAVKQLINNKELCSYLTNSLITQSINNTDEINKLQEYLR